MQQRLARTEVPAESTWKLGDLFIDPAAWQAAYAHVGRLIDELEQSFAEEPAR